MLSIIIILLIVIFILITYLFLLHKELKDIEKEMNLIKKENSNQLIHSKYNLKSVKKIILKINHLLKETKELEIEYNHKNESLKKMITNISHDLRTPLTAALGYINLIKEEKISMKEKEEDLSIIEERIRTLEDLINSFFEFSKIIANNKEPEVERLNIIALLEETIANFYDIFGNENRRIKLEAKEEKIYLFSNKMMLSRIFDNLILNAYKHSTSDLKIEIENKDKVRIVFENILLQPSLDVEKIFNEFYTLDISRTKCNTGLGLTIVKEFVEQLNGRVYAKKEKDILKIIIEF